MWPLGKVKQLKMKRCCGTWTFCAFPLFVLFCAGSSSEGAKEKEPPNAHRKGMDTANFMKLSEKCAQVMID